MNRKRKMSNAQFLLVCFAVGITVAISAAKYYGEPDYLTAVLVALAATVGATMWKGLVIALVKKWSRR